MTTITEEFKVVAISSNTNSFGLKECVMIARNGVVFKACANLVNMPEKNAIVDIPVSFSATGRAIYTFADKGFEIPTRIEDAPKEVLIEVFG